MSGPTAGDGGAQTAPSPHHHCAECGTMFDSAASLQVHLHYHHASWGGPPVNANNTSPTDPDNNNHAPKKPAVANVIAAADSSDNHHQVNIKQEPGTVIKQEPTQQQQHVVSSYHASSSPYDHLPAHQQYSPGYGYDVYYGLENPYMSQDFMGKHPSSLHQHQQQHSHQQHQHQNQQQQQQTQQQVPTRYQPYQHSPRVSSSSPSSAPGVCMPSPSPVQCDKCGMVCETASQLQDHALSHSDAFQYPPMPNTNPTPTGKDSSSEILDLDSHKVVYPAVLPSLQSLQGMQPQWQDTAPPPHQLYQPAFPQSATTQDVKLFRTPQEHHAMQQQGMQQASHPPHMVSPPDFPTTTTPQQHDNAVGGGAFRAQITSSHPVASGAKGPGWKSNEARRPKTYNCTACNKWFTSSGHLKRHYNTTLHKNAVKSSGQPDPANMPISAHHHPGRDPNHPSHHKGGVSPTRPRGLQQQQQQQQRSPEPQGFPQPPHQQQPGPGGYILPHAFGSFSFPGIPPDTGQPPPGSDMQQQHTIETNNTATASTNNHGSPPNGQAGPSVHNLLPIPRGLQILSNNMSATTDSNNIMEETTASTCHMQLPHHQQQQLTAATAHQQQQLAARSLISYRRPKRTTTPPTMATEDHHQAISNRHQMADQPEESSTTSTVFLVIPPGNRITNSLHTIGDTAATTITHDNGHGHGHGCVVSLKDGPQPVPTALYSHHYAHMEYGMMDPLQHPPFSPAVPEQEPAPPSPQAVTSTEQDIKPKVIHRCDACDKQFNKACYLTQHNKSFHCGEKPFKCSRCGKRFQNGATHEEHIAKHAGDKPFKCIECPKQFNHKTDLRRHMCLHSGSKPYACHICGKGFIRKDHMLKHCDTHRKKPKGVSGKRAAAVQA